MNYVVVGSGTAGTAFARKLRFYDKKANIVIVDSKIENQYSPCALPYFIEGIINDVQVYSSYEKDFLKYYKGYKAIKIKDNVLLCEKNKKILGVKFDKLIVATGSKTRSLNISNLKKYYVLKTIEDAKKLKNVVGSVSLVS